MAVDMTRPELFARKASGLIREFGFFDTFVFNVIGYALGLVLAVTPFFAGGVFPGANIFLILILGTVLSLFNGLTYSLLAGAMPRSGGEYVYNGRVLHPAIGFMSSWGFTWSQLLAIGIYTQWTINYALVIGVSTLGYSIGNQALLDFGIFIAQPWPSFIFGAIVLLIVVVIQLAGMRFLRRFLNALFIVATIGSLITLYVFLVNDRVSFTTIFNGFMQSSTGLTDAYNAIITTAKSEGWQPATASLGQAILALPLGYWVFIGFTYSAYIGGEVKEPQKTQSYAIIASLLFGFVLYMAIIGAYYAVVGTEFNDAAAYLQLNTKSPLPVAGVLNFFAGILTNPVLNILMGLSFFLWHFLLLFVVFTICVRNIFAWAFDQVVPIWLTQVTEKTRAPWAATIVVAILSLVLLWTFIFTQLWYLVVNYIVIFSIAFWITSFAAILLPYRKPELFKAAPTQVQVRILGIPLVTIAGVINLLLFTLILYSSFLLPAFSGPVGPTAIWVVVGIYLSGLIIYYVAAAIRRKQGIDFDLLYGEIPPE